MATPEGRIPAEKFLLAAAASLAAFALYAETLCGDVFWQDSGLYNRSVGLLGNSVPPGFPSYHLFCYLFAMLPGLDPVAGMNLFSAVAGAATAFFIVLLFYEIAADAPWRPAAAGVAALAYSAAPTIWLQSTTCEVYTLNMALTGATMFALFAWRRRADVRFLFLAAFVYGVACANHPQQAVLLPVYVAFVIWSRREGSFKLSRLGGVVAFWLAAMSIYLYLPVRSAAGVAMDWGRPRTLYGLYFHLTCKEFQGQMFSSPWPVVAWRIKTAALLYYDQFSWPGLAAAAAGAVYLFIKRRRDFVYFALLSVFTLFLTVNYPSFGFRAWYFTFYMLTALALAYGVYWAASLAARWHRAAACVVCGAALAVAACAIPARFYRGDHSDYPFARDFSANQLRSISYSAMFFLGQENSGGTGGMESLTTLAYVRPDVFFMDTTGNTNFASIFDFAGENLTHAPREYVARRYYEILYQTVSDPRREYYFLYPYPEIYRWGFGLATDGLVYRLVKTAAGAPPRGWLWERYAYPRSMPLATDLDAWGQDVVGNFYYSMSENYRGRDEARAEKYFRLAREVGWRSHACLHNLGSVYYLRGDYAGAAPFFKRSLVFDPTIPETRYLLAECLGRTGDAEGEREQLTKTLAYSPGFGPAQITLETGRYIRW